MSFTDNHTPEPIDSGPPVEHTDPGLNAKDLPASSASAVDVGVADYFNTHPEEAASILVAKAPDVLVLARCIGAPKTANYFAGRLKCKVTEKMIKTIKSKVAKDIILVTREELEAAAQSHPITAARMAREPSLCDPQHYPTSIKPELEDHEVEADAVKRAAVKKTAAKKAAAKKSAAVRSKKSAEAKTTAAPPAGTGESAGDVDLTPASNHPLTANLEKPTGLKQIFSDEEVARKQELVAQLKKEVRGV